MAAAETGSLEILIGTPGGEHVSIRIMSRMHPNAEDYWDGNWLISPLEIVAGGFRAEVGAGLRADELASFRKALERIHASLRGEAVLESMEGWLHLKVVADRLGALRVTGRAVDRPGGNNILSFTIEGLDQTHLRGVISSLSRAEAAFPVLGQPDQR